MLGGADISGVVAGYSLNPDGSFVDGRGRQMSTTVTPPSTPGLMSLSSGESRLPLNSYYTAQIGRNSIAH